MKISNPHRESQMVITCDKCNRIETEAWIYRNNFIKQKRKDGWSIGKKVLCPKCKSKII